MVKDSSKRRGQRRTGSADGSDDGSGSADDDNLSVSSSSTSTRGDSGGADGESSSKTEWQDALFEGIDQLTEKTAAKRLNALQSVRKALADHYAGDMLDTHTETLLHSVQNLFNRGSSQEQALAADILSLVMLNMGAEQLGDSLYREVCDTLATKLRNEQSEMDPGVRAKAIRALGMWRFMTEPAAEVARQGGVLDRLREALWQTAPGAQALDAAVDAWTLVASGLPASMLNNVVLPRYKLQLIDMLQHGSIDVRVAAGRALALLYEAFYQAGQGGTIAASAAAGEGERHDEDLQHVIEAFEELADESSKQHSKQARQQQRQAFRSYLETIESGDVPTEQLTISKHHVELHGWAQLVPLEAVRDLVGQGLGRHFAHNPHVRHMLELEEHDFDPTQVKRLTQLEKKQFLSKQSSGAKADSAVKSKLTRNARSFTVLHDGENETW